MTRNMKRFLAATLLSLTPSAALAEQYGFEGLLFERNEYVSVQPEETIEIPVRRGGGTSALLATTVDTFFIANWTGVNTFPGYSIVGTPNPLPPNPLPPVAAPSISGYFQMIVNPVARTQIYYYTTNAADPTGAAKTCRWQLNITVDAAGVCSGTLNQAAFGNQGVLCTLDTAQSFIDPTTCQSQIVTAIQ
ncbi:hypothetical protein ACLESO_06730 [Pyxidicoccus sp. 3LG]